MVPEMKRRYLGALLVSAWLAVPPTVTALSIQEAILRAKPAVALIRSEISAEVTMNCGRGTVTVRPTPFIETGTGWFVDGRGYVITNAHVVDPVYRRPPWVVHELKKKAIDQACVDPALRDRGLAPGQQPDIEDQIRRDAAARGLATARVVLRAAKITVLLSSGEELAAEVTKFSAPISFDAEKHATKDSGRDLALLRMKEGVYPALALSSRGTNIGDTVHILGFPNDVLAHELLSRGTALQASATSGGVSGLQTDLIGQDIIETDAPAAHGTSGGPAIGTDGSVVGVMTFTTQTAGGSIVQGFNFLIPAKDVKRFLADTSVTKPGDSRFNDVWFASLDALFDERYSTAVARLAEANKLLPDLPDVKRALADAEQKAKNPPPRPFPWAWATLGVTLLSVGVYGGMLGRRWWKNRFRIQPAQVIGLMEKGLSPVILDVRTAADFETSPLKLHGAIRLSPEDAAAGRINLDVDRAQMIVAYCTSPEERSSEQVTQLLHQHGYENIRILKGGLGGWTNARLPVESKASLPSIGLELYKNLTLGNVERRRFAPGQMVFKEGEDPRGEAYVIHAGTVEIKRNINGAERVLRTQGEGELLGELGLFRHAPRSADAIAATDVELLVLRNERLEWLIRNRTQLTIELLKRLSDMIVETDTDRLGRS
jgi:S1-C subfamily serine protease/rhodanese-related sulfurtransferase